MGNWKKLLCWLLTFLFLCSLFLDFLLLGSLSYWISPLFFNCYFPCIFFTSWKEDPGLLPGLERSPGEGHGNPLQYSCLENSMDRGAWRATVHGVTELDLTEPLNTDTHIAIPRMVEISSCQLHMFPAEAKQGCMQLFWISTNAVKSAPYRGLFNAISFFFFIFVGDYTVSYSPWESQRVRHD